MEHLSVKPSKMIQNISSTERFKRAFSPVKDPSAIKLNSGDPAKEFNTPSHIRESACQAMNMGYTHYCSGLGDKELREAICDSLAQDYNIQTSPSNVLITSGAAEAIFLISASFLNPEDEVIVFDPSYSLYPMSAQAVGAKPVYVPLSETFHYQERELAQRISSRAKVLFVNNPNNPTGTCFSKEDLESIAYLVDKHNLLVVSDEVYHKIIFDGREHVCASSIDQMRDRVILINSFSKTYLMTGWRLGYIVARPEIIKVMLTLHRPLIGSVNLISQRAGIAALQGPQHCVREMLERYNAHRKLVYELVNEVEGLHCEMSEATFYAFCRYEHDLSAEEMTKYLLKQGVAVRSGTEFGEKGESHIRIAFPVSESAIREGVRRIGKAVESLT